MRQMLTETAREKKINGDQVSQTVKSIPRPSLRISCYLQSSTIVTVTCLLCVQSCTWPLTSHSSTRTMEWSVVECSQHTLCNNSGWSTINFSDLFMLIPQSCMQLGPKGSSYELHVCERSSGIKWLNTPVTLGHLGLATDKTSCKNKKGLGTRLKSAFAGTPWPCNGQNLLSQPQEKYPDNTDLRSKKLIIGHHE